MAKEHVTIKANEVTAAPMKKWKGAFIGTVVGSVLATTAKNDYVRFAIRVCSPAVGYFIGNSRDNRINETIEKTDQAVAIKPTIINAGTAKGLVIGGMTATLIKAAYEKLKGSPVDHSNLSFVDAIVGIGQVAVSLTSIIHFSKKRKAEQIQDYETGINPKPVLNQKEFQFDNPNAKDGWEDKSKETPAIAHGVGR